jgi:DNA polymerase
VRAKDGDTGEAFPPAPVPRDARGLRELAAAAAGCHACPLYRNATQTVFGAGPAGAPLMFVGEQPGDVEDRAGRPFVGPAGGVLDDVLAAVGVPRERVYVTNAVKHFKFVQQGKRRLHEKPKGLEVRACQPWLVAEIQAVRPRVVVALGATAALALLGPSFRLTRERGRPHASELGATVMATYHPSAVLRARTPADRRALLRALTEDVAAAWALAAAELAGAEEAPR